MIEWPTTLHTHYAIVNFLVLIFTVGMQDITSGGNWVKGTQESLYIIFAVSCKSAIISKLKVLEIVLQILVENELKWHELNQRPVGSPFQQCW